ncbi:ankyrin repeat domain-containing protein [Flavobacterium psychrophilum]|uniref:Ankyrin repeat domain-containing protein n=1 Tax=Flavobacterium psychrophilum TaxID=96345 RepID=A0A7U2NGQ0_FLAPS|nr:ankyrin repeat domain-containing protein [Flavobacterium psychrophilum]QRE04876.1 ankyrin repeat domain-containing protein [Flavobacterium psychrophilum]
MDMKENLKNAICNNDILFLEKNINSYSINYRFEDEDNDTLLLYSISDSSSETFNFLLNNGADINLLNDEGEGILHAIVFSGDIVRLKKIMSQYKPNINLQSKDGATPLLLAISLGKFEIAKFLINSKADVNITDNEGISPLHLIAQTQNIDLVNLLLQNGADIFLKTANGNLALALAVNNGNFDIIETIYNKMYHKYI